MLMSLAVFLFFFGMVLIMTTWVIVFLPETKGSDLENTFRLFQNHWFWGKKTAVGQVHSMQLPSHEGPSAKEGLENGNGAIPEHGTKGDSKPVV